MERDEKGKEALQEIRLEKAGLMYDLIKWTVPKVIVLER
jgi:hypothetical protein